MIIAGEASGDLHGAHLVKAMRATNPDLVFFGIGGDHLRQSGVEIRVDNADIAVVGGSEVFSKLKILWSALRTAKLDLKERRPDLLIVIDFPDFNLLVATRAKKLGIPVLYYISPQIWAWRTKRVKKIKRLVNHMMVIFPFETDFYERWGVPVSFVGHPLLDNRPYHNEEKKAIRHDSESLVVGLLPGSRNDEITRLLPSMLKAAENLSEKFPNIVFWIPVAPTVNRDFVETAVHGCGATCRILVENAITEVLEYADMVITASGTVTLETALAGTPMIIVYKVSKLSYWLGKRLIRVKYIGWPNLIAGKEIVPELIQDAATPERMTAVAASMLQNKSALAQMRNELGIVARSLGAPGASQRAAKIALNIIT